MTNWTALNFDWNQARAFLATAEQGSYTAAAKALGVSQPTLGRQVAALEQSLGILLFEKAGRGLTLTANGQALLCHVRAMAEAANAFSLGAAGRSDTLEGRVCISATIMVATYVLPPLLRQLRQEAPGISLEVLATDATSDLRKREADIAIRHFQPQQGELIAKALPNAYAHLYAHPDYLARLAPLQQPSDLAQAELIGFSDNTPLIEALNQHGYPVHSNHFTLFTDNHLVHWQLVKEAAAVGIIPNFVGDTEPSVQRLFPQTAGFEFPNYLVVHPELRTTRRVRLVFDFLDAKLSAFYRQWQV